ncbi:hypothetical protein [Actinoplanes sp. NPDC020271]|uniref:hypothetical protein n=1 Tax=Actinoplanes sp. NPDC020271 TaxID=3363896 RepID=UPI0037910665
MPQLILIGLILLLWLPATPDPRRRRPVAAVLAVVAVAAALLAHLFPRATAEATFGGFGLAVLIMVVAWGREPRRTWPMVLVGVLTIPVLCLAGVGLRPAPFYPSAEEVLPMPGGLTATVEDVGCGSGTCTGASRSPAVPGRVPPSCWPR